MNCNEIKKHLTQYIDLSLPKKKSADIKRHLASCSECKNELFIMKKYIAAMAALEEVKAPKDFLKQLNYSIEKKSFSERITKLLFFPLKIKIPIEVSGLVIVLAIATFFIIPQEKTINIQYAKSEIKKEAVSSPEALIAQSDKIAAGAPDKSRQTEKQTSDTVEGKSHLTKKSGITRANDSEVYQLALMPKQEAQFSATALESEDTAARSAKKEESASMSPGNTADEKSSAPGTDKDDKAELAKINTITKQYSALPSKVTQNQSSNKNRAVADNSLNQIRNLTTSIKGKVISEELDKEGIQNVTVEIPVKNKKGFLNSLNELGTIKEQGLKSYKEDNDKSSKIKVNIQIMQSE